MRKVSLCYTPLTPSEYRRDVVELLKILLSELLEKAARPQIWFRSVHFNPLNTASLQCPMKDWRIPVNIDKYNEVLRGLFVGIGTAHDVDDGDQTHTTLAAGSDAAAGAGRGAARPPTVAEPAARLGVEVAVLKRLREHIRWLDTNFILSPLWDSAGDGCHYEGELRRAEAEWILHEIFSAGGGAQ